MPLDPTYLVYDKRRHGMDHDRYAWSLLQRRPRFEWGGGKRVALWITVAVDFFPLDDRGEPFKLPGSMVTPYPDLRNFTLRDYGNRVGIYRLMRAFDRFDVRVSWAVNAAVAERLPRLMAELVGRGDEIVGHGYDMASPHHGGMTEDDERALIRRSLGILGDAGAAPVRGWLSPGKAESERTPDLLAEAGLDYFCDWPNDDLPYRFETKAGPLVAMPHSTDLDDRQIIVEYRHDERSFAEQVKDHHAYLAREAVTGGGRILSLGLNPWVIGQPHRIFALEDILSHLTQQADVFAAPGAEILDRWCKASAAEG